MIENQRSSKVLDHFFKKISEESSSGSHSSNLGPCENVVSQGFNSQREAFNQEFDTTTLERDPGLRHQICEHPINECDNI